MITGVMWIIFLCGLYFMWIIFLLIPAGSYQSKRIISGEYEKLYLCGLSFKTMNVN